MSKKIGFLFLLALCVGCTTPSQDESKQFLLQSSRYDYRAAGLTLEHTEKILHELDLIKHELGIKDGFDLDAKQSLAIMDLIGRYEQEVSHWSAQRQILENQIIDLQQRMEKADAWIKALEQNGTSNEQTK